MKKFNIKIVLLCFCLVTLILNIRFSFSNHKNISPNTSVLINPGIEYTNTSFYNTNYFKLDILSDISVNLNYDYDTLTYLAFGSKQFKIDINNIIYNNPLNLNISALFDPSSYNDDFPDDKKYSNFRLYYDYNAVFKISSNDTISEVNFQFNKTEDYGFNLDSQYSIGYYTNPYDLRILTTIEIDGGGYEYLEASINDFQANTTYFLTVFRVQKIEGISFDIPLIITLSIIIPISIASLIFVVSVISRQEYYSKLKNKIQNFSTGVHRLSMEEVLENENRKKIIELILENPGIHFRELKRTLEISSGNLTWHIEILVKYNVIKRKIIDKYVAYFPYYDKNPLSNINIKLQKSKLTLKTLKKIKENPGIWSTEIAKNFNVSKNVIGYHVKKLIDLGLINSIKEGNVNKLYPNLNTEYFINGN